MQESGNNTNCLHLVVGSSTDALENCRTMLSGGDSVLFLDAGVLHLDRVQKGFFDKPVPACHFTAADLDARGLLSVARNQGASVVDDPEFPALLRDHGYCVTWK